MLEETLGLGSPSATWYDAETGRQVGAGAPISLDQSLDSGAESSQLVGKGTAVQLFKTAPPPAPSPLGVGAAMTLEFVNPDSGLRGPCHSLRVGLNGGGGRGVVLTVKPDHSLGLPCLKVRRWQRSPTVLPTLW